MTTDLAARVDAGARLLDEKRPGWHREIAMDKLAMANCQNCILGQIYGNYFRGCVAIQELEFSDWRGFSLDVENSESGQWETLADLWRAEIRNRLEAGS